MTKSAKTGLTVAGLVLVGVALLSWNTFFGGGNNPGPGDGSGSGATHGVPCINPALPIPNELHIHPVLKITANGENIPIPANIGLGVVGCERVLHTHDDTGTIHIEPNFYVPFTLGDFMSVWDKPFSKDHVLDYKADADHTLTMTVDGQPSTEWANLVLKDKQEIVIEYHTVGTQNSADITNKEINTEIALQVLKLDCKAEGEAGTYKRCNVEIQDTNNPSIEVVHVLYDGLYDDSIAATYYSGDVSYVNGAWKLVSEIRKIQSCQPNRGHQDFSSVPCL